MSGRNKVKKQSLYPTQPVSKDASQLPNNLLLPVSGKTVKSKPQLQAQTPNQKIYIRKLAKRHHDILFATGPAGTGKSFIATVHAIRELQAGNIERIVITRPTVTSGDESYGYLPGDLISKLSPWMLPLLDIFKEYYEVHQVEQMIKNEIIEIAPLGFCRGRTFKNCFVIADEAQNCTPDQMKMLLTRIGEGTSMVITGDVEQHDRGHALSGLADITKRLKNRQISEQPTDDDQYDETYVFHYEPDEGHERIGLIEFDRSDVVRHPVIEEILSLYD